MLFKLELTPVEIDNILTVIARTTYNGLESAKAGEALFNKIKAQVAAQSSPLKANTNGSGIEELIEGS